MRDNFLPLEIREEKVYAGFWKRLTAALIDAGVVMLVVFSLTGLLNPNSAITVLILLVATFSFVAYSVYFNYRYGGTIGKLCVGIRITLPNGSRIGLKNALLRSLVDFIFAVCLFLCALMSAVKIGMNGFELFQFISNVELLVSEYPSWSQYLSWGEDAWYLSELLVLLLNRYKRAIHDYMAGTVVINRKFVEQGIAAHR